MYIDCILLLHWVLLSWLAYHCEYETLNVFLWVPLATQMENVLLILTFEILVPLIWPNHKINKSGACFSWRHFEVMIFNNVLISFCFQFFPFSIQSQVRSQPFLFYVLRIGKEVTLCYLLFEVVQTLLHKMVHTRWLFKHIHYWHHETMADRSFTGFSMHPLDMFAQVIIPSFVPTLIFCSCAESTLLFFLLGMWSSHSGHSGYEIPCFCSGTYHFQHHQRYDRGFAPILESFGIL